MVCGYITERLESCFIDCLKKKFSTDQGNLIQGEVSACIKKLEKLVWIPKGRQLADKKQG
jgi:hypothetical protein